MALTEEERNRIVNDMEKLQRQKTLKRVVDEMSRLQGFVDKSEWDSFFASLWWHGGGFFLIGEYFTGVLVFITGYAITLYGGWLAIRSVLSYFFDFERDWKMAGIVILCGFVFDLIMATWSAVAAKGVRERARFALGILRERCKEIASAERI